MKKLKSKYSIKIVIPFIAYILLIIFTAKYTVEIYTNGYFLYPIKIQSKLLDYAIYFGLIFSFFLIPVLLYNNFIRLKIEDGFIKVKRPFGKPYYIYKNNVICGKEDEEYSSYFSARYFILKDKTNAKIKIKVSEYYIRNYKEIRDYFQSLPNESQF